LWIKLCNWLSSVISSTGSLSIDIIYDFDDYAWVNLEYDSVENDDFIDDFTENGFVMNEDSAENEGFDENDCN